MATSKEFDDIMGLARKESAHAGHFYVGVEHLFIALTRLEDGVTASILEEQGIAPRFIRYMLRQELGQGDNRRFWPGFRETPRLHAVLNLAREIAKEKGYSEPTERDLLLGILREGDSLPYRVLQTMDVDLDRLEVHAANWSAQSHLQAVRVPVEVGEGMKLSEEEQEVLQQMFRGWARVVIDRELDRGYTSARVLVACPYRADGRAGASVVVKLDERQVILYEKMRYDSYVRDTLPPATSRVVDNPTVPDRCTLGGLKYTFIRDPDAPGPVDLADYAREHGPQALSSLLWDGLYRVFGETWWSQRHLYQFALWQEYEMILPPALIIEATTDTAPPRRRLTPQGQWSRRGHFAPQEIVSIEGFTVEDFYPARQAIQLTGSADPESQARAGKIEIRGISEPISKYFRGAIVDQIVGRVIYTRDDLLYQQAVALQPDFDLKGERLPQAPQLPFSLPNPIRRYLNLLQRRISGSLSPIHGDLHLHNILVGPGGNAWLIDFAQAREGHTLFDWAVLEVSLLAEIVAPIIPGDSWDDLRSFIGVLAGSFQAGHPESGNAALDNALGAVITLREIVGECLADPNDWREYYAALSMCALRGLRWVDTLSLKSRRLLFLISALAMAAASSRDGATAVGPDVDVTTDLNLEVTDILAGPQAQRELRRIQAANTRAARRPDAPETDSQAGSPIQFSVHWGGEVGSGKWKPLLAYVFEAGAFEVVAQDARRLLEGQRSDLQDSGPRLSRVRERGFRVAAIPHVAGFQFSPERALIRQQPGWQRFDFRFRAAGAEPDISHAGFLTFAIEGVIVADIPLVITADATEALSTSGPVDSYRSIYCSYDPADVTVAARVKAVQDLLESGFMHEVDVLRAGPAMTDRLCDMMGRADSFQLFWSENAARSTLVMDEWRHALSIDKARFIRPVYWARPVPKLPPELQQLDFRFFPELDLP